MKKIFQYTYGYSINRGYCLLMLKDKRLSRKGVVYHRFWLGPRTKSQDQLKKK